MDEQMACCKEPPSPHNSMNKDDVQRFLDLMPEPEVLLEQHYTPSEILDKIVAARQRARQRNIGNAAIEEGTKRFLRRLSWAEEGDSCTKNIS